MQPMLNIALNAARKAGQIILRASEELDTIQVETKGVNDFVSEVDRRAEQELIYHLHKAHPEHAIRGEEGGLTQGKRGPSDTVWIIDPLDGTSNFLRGIPHYCISMACTYKGKLEHALIYDPNRDEVFSASRGRGAQRNGRRIRVSQQRDLGSAMIATGIPFRSHQAGQLPAYCRTLEAVAGQGAEIRRAGSAALDLAYVAAGRHDGFWEAGLKEWDVAAGALLVQEAGGLVSDYRGGSDFLTGGEIVAGGPKCFKLLLQAVNRHVVGNA